METERFTPEAFFHAAIHFLGVLLLGWVAIFLPLWIAIPILIVEYLQMKMLGNCFLTVFAHKRGYMQGMSYWQYIPHLLGVKNYQAANKIISHTIEYTLVGILLVRLILLVLNIHY